MGSVMAIKDSELSIIAAATVESHDRQCMVGRGGTFSSNFDTSNQISTVRNGIFNCRWILRIKVLIFAELRDSNQPRAAVRSRPTVLWNGRLAIGRVAQVIHVNAVAFIV